MWAGLVVAALAMGPADAPRLSAERFEGALLSAGGQSFERQPEVTLEKHTARMLFAQRALKRATATSFVLSGLIGSVVGYNRPTWLGEGACAEGRPVLGTYGCEGLESLHNSMGITTVLLYTATGVVELATPGRGHYEFGLAHKVLTWVHVLGMLVQPVFGIIANVPAVIGVTDPEAQTHVGRDMRSAGLGLGYVVVGAFVGTAILEELAR